MDYLVDNDVIIKLYCLDLLDHFSRLLEGQRNQWHILTACKFQIRNRYNQQPDSVKCQVENFLSNFRELRLQPDLSSAAILNQISGVDAGEAILFSTGHHFSDFRIITGDKRCIKALATAHLPTDFVEQYRGKVICFEQIVQRLFDANNEAIYEKIHANLECDKTMKIFFGGNPCNSAAIRDGLKSYIEELIREGNPYVSQNGL